MTYLYRLICVDTKNVKLSEVNKCVYKSRDIIISKGFFVSPADVSGVTIYIQRAKKNKTSEEKAK